MVLRLIDLNIMLWNACVNLNDGSIDWRQFLQIAFYLGDQTAMCAEVAGCLLGVCVALKLLQNCGSFNVQEVCEDLGKTWLSDRG